MNNDKKAALIVLEVFALVIVTVGASFALFTFSRLGRTSTTITSGDIEFSYLEGDSVTLENAFPVADSIGASDTANEYNFTVKMNSSSSKVTTNYNVTLLTNNTGDNNFKNSEIKYNLEKNNTFVIGSNTTGELMSSISGFSVDSSTGLGTVLQNQEIAANQTDTYKLRIWIDESTNYSGDIDSNGTMTGTKNKYTYSLKVKVDANATNSTIAIENVSVNNEGTITADISDPNGLKEYAVTQSSTTPIATSADWNTIDDTSAMSNDIRKVALVTSKIISYSAKSTGTYYIHVKNTLEEVNKQSVDVSSVSTIIDNVAAVPGSAAEAIVNLAKANTTGIRIDTHEATGNQQYNTVEYRYYGYSSIINNYVTFNNQKWKIIGIFDVDDGTGKIEKRMKLISTTPITNQVWDSSDSTINIGRGVNEWSQADIMTLLNSGAYWNRTTGTCYKYGSGDPVSNTCDFSTTGLTSDAKTMIGNAKWYTGALNSFAITAEETYQSERSDTHGNICPYDINFCNESIPRTSTWIGKVGLIYPSDYLYASDLELTSDDNTTKCGDATIQNYRACHSNIADQTFNTITPFAITSNNSSIISIIGVPTWTGTIGSPYQYPTVYLNADVKITGGTGSYSTPYTLGL